LNLTHFQCSFLRFFNKVDCTTWCTHHLWMTADICNIAPSISWKTLVENKSLCNHYVHKRIKKAKMGKVIKKKNKKLTLPLTYSLISNYVSDLQMPTSFVWQRLQNNKASFILELLLSNRTALPFTRSRYMYNDLINKFDMVTRSACFVFFLLVLLFLLDQLVKLLWW